jgi:raffinose/stachyose/melibiose transport system permease protein
MRSTTKASRVPSTGLVRTSPFAGWSAGRLARDLRRSLISYLFILPTFAFLVVFVYQPTVNVIYHSFFRWDGFQLEHFVGLQNYTRIAQDPAMAIATRNMVLFGIGWLLQRVSPLVAAELIFNLRSPGARNWYRTLFVLPVVVPFLVTILIWRFIFEPMPGMGLLNNLLAVAGLPRDQHAWLAEPDLVIPALLFVGFPWMSGWAFLLLYAALQKIPSEIVDAAAIDGSSIWQRIVRIDVPLVLGAVRLIWIQTIIETVQEFGFVLIMTGGGPAYASMVPGLVLYFTAFRGQEMGYGAAIGVFMFILILTLTFLSIRYIRPTLAYERE